MDARQQKRPRRHGFALLFIVSLCLCAQLFHSARLPGASLLLLPGAPRAAAGAVAPSSCALVTCSNRTLLYTQDYAHPFFTRFALDESRPVRRRGLYPTWCRVPHLQALRAVGARCAVYADDDVYLNLDRLAGEVRRGGAAGRLLLAYSNENFNRTRNINAGLLAFPHLQHPFVGDLLTAWRRAMSVRRFRRGLRDQAALAALVSCAMPHVQCYHLDGWGLGIVKHCFSAMDKSAPGSKQECMQRAKRRVRRWDASPFG